MARRKTATDRLGEAARDSLAKLEAGDKTRRRAEEESRRKTAEDARPQSDVNLCPRCGSPRGPGASCAACAFDFSASPKTPEALPAGTLLDERFIVGEALAASPFGIAYRTFDKHGRAPRDLWELFPRALVRRTPTGRDLVAQSGAKERFARELRQFLDQGAALVGLRHDGILPTLAAFSANGTGYLVSEPAFCPTLLQRMQNAGGMLSWPELGQGVLRILSALDAAHKAGIVHGAVSPDAILFPEDAPPALAGFGAAPGQAPAPGDPYAAPEILRGEAPGPAADIYAMGAAIYHALTGEAVPAANLRKGHDALRPLLDVFGLQIPKEFSDAIAKALELNPDKRWPTAGQMRDALSAAELLPLEAVVRERERQARLETERKAKEEAARLKAEAERKAQEEEAERKAEAERQAKAAAAKLKAEEEARRKAKEQEEKAARDARKEATREIREDGKTRRPVLSLPRGGVVLTCAVLIVLAIIYKLLSPQPPTVPPPPGPQPPDNASATAPPAYDDAVAKAKALMAAGNCGAAKQALAQHGDSPEAKALLNTLRQPGRITIVAIPWGDVILDGKATGKVAPLNGLKVPCGEHVVSLRNPNVNAERSVSLTVRAGQSIKISFTSSGNKVVN
jgi:hypothetical protein